MSLNLYAKNLFFQKKSNLSLFLCFILLLSGCSAIPTASSNAVFYDKLSNKKEGWGFRRTENGPDFSADQIRLMSDYDCIYKEDTSEKNIYLTTRNRKK